ncbi:MAG: hypothetical protein LBK60_00990 [Verrucomicrobiales bacterium]|jgi:alpha-mannosidase|nr:hypothetical protein [Verrucomicrobiales bacterium]
MLPINHLLSLVPSRITATVIRLQENLWRDLVPLTVAASASAPDYVPLAVAKKLRRATVDGGTVWGKLFDQRWCRVLLPRPADGKVFFNWRDEAEATLWVNGAPYFGLDVAHRFCRLPKGARELWLECVCVQSGVWHQDATGLGERGSRFDGAFLCRRDADAWRAYHDLKCLSDLMLDERRRENPLVPPLPSGMGEQTPTDKVSPFYRRLLRLLDDAVNELDRRGPRALSRSLAAAYAELRRDQPFQHCALTGHAHVDLVWLWPERVGELKAAHVFATVNHLLDEYPEFKFAYSQPASYAAVARHAPALYQKVRRRIASGRWQATGAMYVESDTLLACGEALARSFTLGQRGFAAISGRFSTLTWLPDVFGYSGSLPQLMKLGGAEYFFTTKMTWNAVNRFPYSSFVWRGIDGSEVVAHVTQESNYVTHMRVADVKNALHGHQQADVHGEFLLPVGFGDGGGGPTDEMCERARRLGGLPGMPTLAWDQPENFFARLGRLRARLPVHQGECYLEYHRGTYTTHGALKAAFRATERALQTREAAAVATAAGVDEALTAAWKRAVFAQFHDYIPGSSIAEVYAEAVPELRALSAAQLGAARKLLARKTGGGAACVFNPLPVPVRRWLDEKTFVHLPPLAGDTVKNVTVSADDQVTVSARGLTNKFVTLTLNAAGAVNALEIRGKKIPLTGPLGALTLYPDRAANFEAWDIDRQALSLGEPCAAPARITAARDGAGAALTVRRRVGRNSAAAVTFRLEAGADVVRVEVALDWREPEHLLKMNFPANYQAANARFGIPYGSILRPQQPGATVSEAMWEVPFSRWLAVFDEGERDGLCVVSEDKYGATVRCGNIGVSLVRSPRMTGFEYHRIVRKAGLARLQPDTIFSDLGRHVIRLAFGRYDAGAPLERHPAALADTLFTPPARYRGAPTPPSAFAGLDSDGTLLPCWALPADDDPRAWILRLNEVAGRPGAARLRLAKGWAARAVDLLGRPLAGKKIRGGKFDYRPYEIISLRIEPSNG